MKRVAVCVPTYNHPDVVNDVLEKSIKEYHASGIDIYYYDSSEGNETELVIKKYQEAGFDNLYYLKISSELGVDEKVLLIFSGEGLKEEYDYIWPVKDRVYCPKVTLESILEAAEEGYDSIFLGVMNTANGIQMGNLTYESAVEFYRDWGWLSTSLDVVIYNKQTLLNDFSVEAFKKRYVTDYNIYWCTCAHFFNQIAQIDDLRIRLLRDNRTGIFNSPLGKSSWKNNTFKIWQEYWIKVNLDLPECYNEYKKKVIKETASLPWLLGSIPALLELHENGVLTPNTYENIKDDWYMVSDVPLEKVYQIATGTFDKLHDLWGLQNSKNEMITLLTQCITLLKEDKLTKEQIPFDSIHTYIFNAIIAKKKAMSQDYFNVINGSVLDIQTYILRADTNKEDTICAMQMYITFLLLTLV